MVRSFRARLSCSIFALFLMEGAVGCVVSSGCRIPQDLAESVSTYRQLAFRESVACDVVRPGEAREVLQRSLARHNSPTRLRYEGEVLRLLGVVARDFNYIDRVLDRFAEDVAGFYSPERQTYAMVMGADWHTKRLVAVHELTHALQDQHFGLSAMLQQRVVHDAALARAALLEGDAHVVTLRYRNVLDCDDLPRPEGPPAMHMLSRFPYTWGTALVCDLLRHGGHPLLNRAFAHPPTTTRDVMEPARYRAALLNPQSPAPSRLLSIPAESVFSDTLGQFTIYALLANVLSDDVAQRAARGWLEDVVSVSADDEAIQRLVWRSRWQTKHDAAEFFNAIREYYAKATGIAVVRREVTWDEEHRTVQVVVY